MSGLFDELMDMEELTRLMHEKRPLMPWMTTIDLKEDEKNKRPHSVKSFFLDQIFCFK